MKMFSNLLNFMCPSILKRYFYIRYPYLFKDDMHFLLKKWHMLNGTQLNIDDPRSFNEKLNWLKIYNRNPLYTLMADKYEVKKIVASLIGEEYVVPCYGIWNNFDEIDFDSLPNQFVIKATHDSSGAIVVRDKGKFNKKTARNKYMSVMKRNWFWPYREWVYKDIKPRILVDKFLDDHSGHELRDYKFWCFNGEPKVMYCTNKASDVFENFYDMNFNPLDINHGFRRNVPEFEKPEAFELMKSLATKLSKDIPFVRVDFFYVDGKVYFGEFTFYDWAGFRPFESKEWDLKLGGWIKLPDNKQ